MYRTVDYDVVEASDVPNLVRVKITEATYKQWVGAIADTFSGIAFHDPIVIEYREG